MDKFYKQDPLPYDFADLEPLISREQLALHYQKHHAKYVENSNNLLKTLDNSRSQNNISINMAEILKSLSFNVGGHVLHSIFWNSMSPKRTSDKPTGKFASAIEEEFGSFENFKKEFSQVAEKVEGSGWAVLSYCRKTGRPTIMQIEKHNVNIYPSFAILMALDVWEHAYYLDYKNERARFIEAFWQLTNWEGIGENYESLIK